MGREWPRRSLRWLLGLGLPLALVALALARVDLSAGARRVLASGPLALLGFLPAALVLGFDALGWRRLLAAPRRRQAPLGRLFAARLGGEAVSQTLPSAGLSGEAASAWYLSRHTQVSLGEAIGSLAARRVRVAQGHGTVLVVAALAALATPGIPRRFVTLDALGALALLGAAGLGSLLLLRGEPFARLQESLRQLPWEGLREWVGARVASLGVAHREATRPFVEPWRQRLAASACFALVFLSEAFETWALLWLVGAELSFTQALAIEPLVSLLRALAFFVPAGLGVQELSYVALLALVGAPQLQVAGAAFLLLKRTKELAWATLGWSVLLATDTHARPRAAPLGPDEAPEPDKEEKSEPGAAKDPVHLRVAEPDDADAPDRARVA